MGERDANFIKNLVNSKQISVNAQHPENGRTLLMFSVIIGNFDLVKAICNNGANVSIKDEDGLDALDYAIKFGQYKITELVFYRTLSGKTGNDLKQIATAIHAKNKEAEYIKDRSPKLIKEITNFMINAIKERAPFDPSMLFYAWQFNENSLTSPLWCAMMETYEQILSDTKDKKGWKWLKEHFLNSLIWFLPHPYSEHISFEYKEDFDRNGIFYALGTNFGKKSYENPAKTGKVTLDSTAMHKGSQPNYEFVGRNKTLTLTQNEKASFFSVDFGKYGIKPTHYTLRGISKINAIIPIKGSYARLKGLVKASEFNGKAVKIMDYVEKKDRWKVKLLHAKQEKKNLGVKAEKFDLLSDWE